MATCSPLALESRWCRCGVSLRQDRARRRRNTCQPPQASPASPIAHVEGSGTATELARRKPMKGFSFDGGSANVMEDDKMDALLFQ